MLVTMIGFGCVFLIRDILGRWGSCIFAIPVITTRYDWLLDVGLQRTLLN